ncbi:NTP transferase domain-containing protein [Tumebacillus sp. ITR2]|uniref:NTP transferase domain-containing protein n=1 Tax=Tumebacillus amylolyticus TaxID=2801339 RepID=A0ABS1JEA8_9BACL|nr:sugar phosphate nucleotidyltransferase [Tumebacillus amylolyticus]MBL0388637.1 NTP transferase domain-containing protein [Tumebacillus amylolyticus]
MKGVILCAGSGSRIRPFSLTLPKPLLPVLNRPLLEHAMIALQAIGIEEIAIVINPSQQAEFEHVNAKILYQEKPLGIANAVSKAATFVGSDSFVLLLGDNLILEPLNSLVQAAHGKSGAVLLQEVETPQDYGIAKLVNGRLVKLVEKPRVPEGNLAVVGAYLFDPSIFQAVQAISPSARGEYEITDAMQWLIEQGRDIGYAVSGNPCFDVGTIERWLSANRYLLQQNAGQVQLGNGVQLDRCTLVPPVLIGDHCVLQDAVIGPNVSIQNGSHLKKCTVRDSILLEHVTLLDAEFTHSILGRHADISGTGGKSAATRGYLGDFSKLVLGQEGSDPR